MTELDTSPHTRTAISKAEAGGPWFAGVPFTSGRQRVCAVCGKSIEPGQRAVADFELQQCAHLGCGRPRLGGRA
jgi:hypothetical protein